MPPRSSQNGADTGIAELHKGFTPVETHTPADSTTSRQSLNVSRDVLMIHCYGIIRSTNHFGMCLTISDTAATMVSSSTLKNLSSLKRHASSPGSN